MVEWSVFTTEVCHIVRIQGSNDLSDWIFNFLPGRTIGDNVRVNRWDRYEALRVLRGLRDYSDKPIYVWGHSRGGAIAQIVAYELARQRRMVSISVFGSKRTGNRRFVRELFMERSYASKAFRHRGDWIALLPPWYWPIPALVFGRWAPVWIAHNEYSFPRMQ